MRSEGGEEEIRLPRPPFTRGEVAPRSRDPRNPVWFVAGTFAMEAADMDLVKLVLLHLNNDINKQVFLQYFWIVLMTEHRRM